jgi:chromosomal replication initiator protein
MRQFEAKYQDLDLFLIDDIQSFGKREGTQTNFFLVFENMVPHGKQIVLTSDTYPKSLKDFQERLLSRMTQGLTVEVEPPELEMRVQILHQKAKSIGLDLPEEVAEVIAEHLKSNVRELEGAVQQIYAFTHFSKMPVTLESVKLALRDVFRQNSVPVTLESIQQRVAEYYNLKQADMTSKSRIAPVAKARQIAMYLCKELTQKSLPEIGKSFGGRDHATVIHAHKKITAERTRDEALRHDLNVLTQRIKN